MIEFWHNPRCSKSRQALALLEARNASVQVRRYLEDAPSQSEIERTRAALGNIPLAEMMRVKDKHFRDLGLSKSDDEATLLAAMVAHPILIERPIAISGTRAVIGRPLENVLDLI